MKNFKVLSNTDIIRQKLIQLCDLTIVYYALMNFVHVMNYLCIFIIILVSCRLSYLSKCCLEFLLYYIDVNTSSSSFTCELCGIKFSIKATYEQHQKSHTKDRDLENIGPIEDNIADTKAQFNESVEYNVDTVSAKESEQINFSCDMCENSFAYQSLLNHHRTTVHETKRFLCQIEFCNQIFTTADDLKRHEDFVHANAASTNKDTTNDIKCTYAGCTQLFPNYHLLKRHQAIHRLKAYTCNGCNKKYYSEGVYQTHVRLCQPVTNDVVLVADEEIDSGPVLCKMCNQLFENRKILKFHRKFCADEEAEEAERKRVIEIRAQLSSTHAGTGIEEIYVKQEVDDEIINNLVPEF